MSGAVTVAGMVHRLTRCETHGREYPQMYFRSLPEGFWVGSCDKCNEEAKLLEQARQMEQATAGETLRQAGKIVESSEKQIATQVESEIDDYVESVRQEAQASRSEWTADVRRRHWDAAVQSVQAERTAEFVEQLKTTKAR